jgi:hypothetical protein
MDPKHLLLAHGEKAVVLVVAGACAWFAVSSFTDESIRPKGVTQQIIDEHITAIDQRMQSKDVPTLKPAPPYLESMKARFGKDVPSPTRMSWLMNHVDIGGIGRGIYFYIYELSQPTVSARDNIGTIEIVVQPPRNGGSSDRISSEWEKPWVRTTERTVQNSARLLGVIMQIQIGQGQWRPFKAPGVLDGGFIPLEVLKKTGGKFSLPTEAVWQRHAFRVESVVKATGFTGENEKADETILVHDAHEQPYEAPKDWGTLFDEWSEDKEPGHEVFMRQWVKGEKNVAVPGVVLAKNEQIYLSDWNAPLDASVQATADVRFAFEKSSTDPSDPSKEVATFMLSKQFKGKGGAVNAWLDKPEIFKLSKGEVLGGPRDVLPPDSKLKRQIDLTTPFVLDELRHDVDRVWYYELKAVSRATPGKDRDLAVTAVTKKTDVAVLKNTKTGATLEMTRLADVRRPTRVGTIYYPVYPSEIYEEDKEFLKSPADFQQWGLKPPEPVKHEPGTGPLEELREKTGDSIYKTDTAYYEMPDGRVYWWESVNHQLMHDPPSKDDDATSVAPKAGVPLTRPAGQAKAPAPTPAPRPERTTQPRRQVGPPPGTVPPQGVPPPGQNSGGPPADSPTGGYPPTPGR